MNCMHSNQLIKGIGIGLTVGATVGMLVSPRKRNGKTAVSRALRTAGDVVDGISGFMNL